jgi:hypothetical protein
MNPLWTPMYHLWTPMDPPRSARTCHQLTDALYAGQHQQSQVCGLQSPQRVWDSLADVWERCTQSLMFCVREPIMDPWSRRSRPEFKPSYHPHITLISHSYHTHIICHIPLISHSYNPHITLISHSYHPHITLISHSCHPHITF